MRTLVFIFFAIIVFTNKVLAQCAMCKGSAESSLETGNTQAAGINAGVLYVLVIVIAILSGFVYLFWKYRNADGQYEN
jgi:heme/copper-type cytochrome/quinol oxidase subunit 2